MTPSDHFTVYPSKGELLPASEDGTLIKVGFTSPSYGKIYSTQLIISVKKDFFFFMSTYFYKFIL